MNKQTLTKRKRSSPAFVTKKIRQDEQDPTQENYIINRRFLMAGGYINGRRRLTNVIRNYGGHVTTQFGNLDYIVIGPGQITPAMTKKLAQDTITNRIDEDELLNLIRKSQAPNLSINSDDDNNEFDCSSSQSSQDDDVRIKTEEVDLSDLELDNVEVEEEGDEAEEDESIPVLNSLYHETENNNIRNKVNIYGDTSFEEEEEGGCSNFDVDILSLVIPISEDGADNKKEDGQIIEQQSHNLEQNGHRVLEKEIPNITSIEYYKQRAETIEKEKLELSSLLQNKEQQIECLTSENKKLMMKVQEQQLLIDKFRTERDDNGCQNNINNNNNNNAIVRDTRQQQKQNTMIKKPLLPHPPQPLPRSIQIPPPTKNITVQDVPPEALSETESLKLILDELKIEDCPKNRDKCQELSQLLTRLPLALKQAVNYIKFQQEEQEQQDENSSGILNRISQYIQNFNLTMYKTNLIEEISTSSRFSVYNSWNLTLEKVKTLKYGSFAIQILNNVAFLLAQNIPLSLLRFLLSPEIQGTDLTEGLTLLQQYSLVTMDQSQSSSLSIAKQLQLLVLLNIIEYDNMFVVFNNFLDKCNSTLHTLINSPADNRLDIDEILLNFQHIVEHTRPNLIPETNELLNFSEELAQAYQHFGQYEKALDLYNKILERDVNIYGENNKVTRNLQHNVAHLTKLNEDLEKALILYLKIVEKDTKLLGDNHPITLNTNNNIACLLRDLGRFDESLKLFNQVFEQRKKVLASNHPSTLNSERGIASVYAKKGEFNRALRMYIQVEKKQITHKDLGPDHLDTLATMQEKCIVWIQLDQRESAETLLREIYMKRKKALGENHPETISTLSWIAVCMGNMLK